MGVVIEYLDSMVLEVADILNTPLSVDPTALKRATMAAQNSVARWGSLSA